MTEDEGGPPADRGGTPEPAEEDRGRDQAGTTGTAPAEGGRPPAGGRGASGGSSPGDCPAIDLDSAHDRAS